METQKNQMLTTDQLAERLGVPAQSVRRWRMLGLGPAYMKYGDPVRGPVRYRTEDVEAWERTKRLRTRETPVDA